MTVPKECMTRENTPYPRPLSKGAKAEALEYIRKCEEGPNGHTFKDFERQIRAYAQSRKTNFNHTFVEYVVLEVALRNFAMWEPPASCEEAFADTTDHWMLRAECLYRYGANQKCYADIYHDLINDALIDAGVPCSFKCCRYWTIWGPRLTLTQKEDNYQNYIMLEFERQHALGLIEPHLQESTVGVKRFLTNNPQDD